MLRVYRELGGGISTCMNLFLDICAQKTSTDICICVCTYVDTYLSIYTYKCIYVYIYIYVCEYVCMYVHMFITWGQK